MSCGADISTLVVQSKRARVEDHVFHEAVPEYCLSDLLCCSQSCMRCRFPFQLHVSVHSLGGRFFGMVEPASARASEAFEAVVAA